MRTRFIPIALLAVLPAFGQMASHTISITATRSIYLQPDQVVVGLSVISATTATLDQVTRVLSTLGITVANLNGIGTNSNPPTLQWNFTLAAPLSSLTATLASVGKLQQTIAQNNSGLTLTFTVNGTQASDQLRQSQSCPNADLVADATSQARKLATAAGMNLGPLLSVSDTPAPGLVAGGRLGGFANFISGDFVASTLIVPATSPAITCSIFAEFRLLP
jgi:hypothetical protein